MKTVLHGAHDNKWNNELAAEEGYKENSSGAQLSSVIQYNNQEKSSDSRPLKNLS